MVWSCDAMCSTYALWPLQLAAKPRDWVGKNLHEGVIKGARFALRGREGARLHAAGSVGRG